LTYLSICCRSVASMMWQSTRRALLLYRSILAFMSFISEEVTMITSSLLGLSSLMIK